MPSCFSLSSTTPVAIAKPLHPLLPLLLGFALASGWLSEPSGLVWLAEPEKEVKNYEIEKRDGNTFVQVRCKEGQCMTPKTAVVDTPLSARVRLCSYCCTRSSIIYFLCMMLVSSSIVPDSIFDRGSLINVFGSIINS